MPLAAPESVNNQPLILVVDDHEAQRTLFKLLADHIKITAHVVANAAEALEAVETYKFDAILMDVRMPGIDGLECTRKIREIEKITGTHVPIIAATACCFLSDRADCMDAGMDDYLAKPFSLAELKEKLDIWIVPKSA